MTDRSSDVIVIGAGIIGLACAFRLAREGKSVLLLDRDQPGRGASFGNAGHIATEQVFPLASPEVMRGALRYLLDGESPLRIRPAYLFSILPWLIRFAKAARAGAFDRGVMALSALQSTAHADMASLLSDANASRLLKMNGHLVLVENAKSISAAQREITRSRAFGIDADWISATEAKQIAPDITAHIEGALKFTGTGHVADPYAVCTALHDAYLAAGGKFVRAEVLRIENAVDGFTAHTATDAYRAKHLVLSCGAWSKTLATQLGYAVPLDT